MTGYKIGSYEDLKKMQESFDDDDVFFVNKEELLCLADLLFFADRNPDVFPMTLWREWL